MGVSTLCIIAVFLGVLGIAGGGIGLFDHLWKGSLFPADPDPEVAQLDAELDRRLEDSKKGFRPLLVAVYSTAILASALLAVAGVAGFNLKGLGVLRLALAANLALDVVETSLSVLVQMRSLPIMRWYNREMTADGEMPAAMTSWMDVTLYVSIAATVAWGLAKLVFYVWGLVYFGRPAVRDLFEGRVSSALPPSPAPGAGAS